MTAVCELVLKIFLLATRRRVAAIPGESIPAAWLQPSTLDKPDQDDNNRDHQQYVDEATHAGRRHQTQCPEHH
jgi:hypothetical protein